MPVNQYVASSDHKYGGDWHIDNNKVFGILSVMVTDENTKPAHKLGVSASVEFEAKIGTDDSVSVITNKILWAGEVIPYEDFVTIENYSWEVGDLKRIAAAMEVFIKKELARH